MSLIVQKLRLQRGWSQQQLAELSGLSVRTVQRIEGGQNATVESLKSLAAVFEVDFQELRAAVEDAQPSAAAPAVPATPQPDPEIPVMSTFEQAPIHPARSAMGYHERLLAMPDDEVRAFREVKRLRGFYIHLMIYVLVITGLVILNLVRTPDRLWVLGPAFGWGIGILAHGLSVFGKGLVFGPEWERRQIEKRIGRKL